VETLDVAGDGRLVGETHDRGGGGGEEGPPGVELVHARLHLAYARGEDGEVEPAVLDGPVQVVELLARLGELGGDRLGLGDGGVARGVGLGVHEVEQLAQVAGREHVAAQQVDHRSLGLLLGELLRRAALRAELVLGLALVVAVLPVAGVLADEGRAAVGAEEPAGEQVVAAVGVERRPVRGAVGHETLHRKFGAGRLIGACARVFQPGCQLDTMLMLIGGQGVGKSRACAALVPDRAWFGDSTFDIANKDAFINLHGKWIYELAECESLKKASDDARKAFITSRVDRYRKPFGRLAEDHPRQVVFVATTNNIESLTDPTGARRFWTVLVGDPDVDGLACDRDQLFAEALVRYRAGEPWHLDREHAALLVEAQRQFEVPEAWEGVIAPWVERQEAPFTVEDAMREGLGLPVERWTPTNRQRVGKALARLGCAKTRPRAEGARRVWCWERVDRPDQTKSVGGEV
jgi:hypothetical protein